MNYLNTENINFDDIDSDYCFNLFLPCLNEFIQGLRSIDKDYWRSRWFDWINYKNTDTHEIWVIKFNIEKLFDKVWEKYKEKFIN